MKYRAILALLFVAPACKQAEVPVNLPPVASAGADRVVIVGEEIRLNGAKSRDPEGEILKFTWTILEQPERSQIELGDIESPRPIFRVDAPKRFVFQLVVSDGVHTSAPDTVEITTLNRAPIAEAGPAQKVDVAATVTLDGTGSSDPDTDPLQYRWKFLTLPTGSASVLSDPTAAQPTFTTDATALYELELVVNDGEADSEPDLVRVLSGIDNFTPVADAGPDRRLRVGGRAQLDGSRSLDDDGDTLTYAWRVVSAPAGSAAQPSDATVVSPLITPDVPGVYQVELTVNDGLDSSAPDTAEIFACGPIAGSSSGELCRSTDDCENCTICLRGVCAREESLRVSLVWTANSDFDIHVLTPNGIELFFANPIGEGGELDVDDCIATCRRPDTHIENIFFSGNYASGTYTAWAENFDGRAPGNALVEVAGNVNIQWSAQLPALSGAATPRWEFFVP